MASLKHQHAVRLVSSLHILNDNTRKYRSSLKSIILTKKSSFSSLEWYNHDESRTEDGLFLALIMFVPR